MTYTQSNDVDAFLAKRATRFVDLETRNPKLAEAFCEQTIKMLDRMETAYNIPVGVLFKRINIYTRIERSMR